MKKRKGLVGCTLGLSLAMALASTPVAAMGQEGEGSVPVEQVVEFAEEDAEEAPIEEEVLEVDELGGIEEDAEGGSDEIIEGAGEEDGEVPLEDVEGGSGEEDEEVPPEDSEGGEAESGENGEVPPEGAEDGSEDESKESEEEESKEDEKEDESEKQMLDIIYVGGEAASDENTGATAETPVATLAEALNWVNEGGTIVLTGDVDGSEITKGVTLQSDGGVLTASSIYVSSAYINVVGNIFANGVDLRGNGSNSISIFGGNNGFSSLSGFVTVSLDGAVIRNSDWSSAGDYIVCDNLNLNGGCVVSGNFNVGSLYCAGGNNLNTYGNLYVASLTVDGTLEICINGMIGEDMRAGVTVITAANGISEDTFSNVNLSSLNSDGGRFVLELDGNSIVTATHEHTLVYVDKVEPTCTEDGAEGYYVCSECGGMYSDAEANCSIGWANPIEKLGHEWADTLTYDETGHWYGCKHGCDEKESFEEHNLNGEGECVCGYKFFALLEGEGGIFTLGSKEGLTFRFDGSVEDLKTVYIDGIPVDASNYKVESGSVVLTISSEYLNKLSVGVHTLVAENTKGTTAVGFKIVEAEAEKPESENKGETGKKDETAKKEEAKKLDTAQTGDTTNLVMLLSMTVLFGLATLVSGIKSLGKRRR